MINSFESWNILCSHSETLVIIMGLDLTPWSFLENHSMQVKFDHALFQHTAWESHQTITVYSSLTNFDPHESSITHFWKRAPILRWTSWDEDKGISASPLFLYKRHEHMRFNYRNIRAISVNESYTSTNMSVQHPRFGQKWHRSLRTPLSSLKLQIVPVVEQVLQTHRQLQMWKNCLEFDHFAAEL